MLRREFLKGSAWMAAAAMAAGCAGKGAMKLGGGGSMFGFRCKPLGKIRVAFAGLGGRGTSALRRIAQIPGCEVVAICDLRASRTDVCNGWLVGHGYAKAREYLGPEAYKAMCDSPDVDVVYVTTGWQMHEPIGIYAVNAGKHTFVEVPAALSVEGCWAFVDGAERNKVHCMMLENCCYGEAELLMLNLCRQGLLGRLVHGEAAYIHDLRLMNYSDKEGEPGDPKRGYWRHWRLAWNKDHKGNQYPTHGLGPICQYMGVNRGDRLDYLVSLESGQFNFEEYAASQYPEGDWHRSIKVGMGDMNSTLVRTVKGRSILVQHDVSSPRPYTRINRVTGTMGIAEGCYFADTDARALMDGCVCRFGWADKPGGGVHSFFGRERMEEMRLKYRHPLMASAGAVAKRIGGHGGMDFLMDLRWAYCLQNGLPLDMDVYDLATWCSICELSERSVRSRSMPVDIPDFTRGGWERAEPLGIVDVDLSKMKLDAKLSDGAGQMEIRS